MARFSVYRSTEEAILILDLQADVLDALRTRVVVPLYPVEMMSWSIGRMNPRFDIEGIRYTMATQRIAAINIALFGPFVADLSARADDITAATDFLFQGF
ncbi:toxin CcdB [Neorhizobium galegae]|uniref:CcdB family protein n=1 Tax=Neorhizobium galegae TaxID=399 RepID=UPI001AE8FB30|nr:CcdB family protein [Neorhizobium galegae]MBP2548369.1 toxin CcdB [Neorhizobium galegae]